MFLIGNSIRFLNAFIVPVFFVVQVLLITKPDYYPWASWNFGQEILAVVGVLLSSADLAFEKFIGDIVSNINSSNAMCD